MPKDNREDILLDYAFISLISSKTQVIIIGGGRAGYIKAKSFLKRSYKVTVLAKEFSEDLLSLSGKLTLIKDKYSETYILDKHLVIVATDSEKLNIRIKADCEKYAKIYLDASNFKSGLFLTPVYSKTENVQIGIHTTVGSPKTSLFLSEKIKDCISEYDDFVSYIGILRHHILNMEMNKNLNLEVMSFVNTDDFYFFYRQNKHELILRLFWRDDFDF